MSWILIEWHFGLQSVLVDLQLRSWEKFMKLPNSSNAALCRAPRDMVAVFVGETGGIGAAAPEAFVINAASTSVYVIARSEAHFSQQRLRLEHLNPNARIVFIQAEVTLLHDVDAACREIGRCETMVDVLYMSAGLLAFGGPDCKLR